VLRTCCVALTLATVGLVACGAGSTSGQSTTPTPTLGALSTENVSPTPPPLPPSPTATEAAISISCNVTDYSGDLSEDSTVYFDTFRDAWSKHYDDCDGTLSNGELSSQQQHALTLAYGADAESSSIGFLYAICAQSGSGAWSYLEDAGSSEQIAEIKGALLICPDHPDRKLLRRLIRNAQAKIALQESGRIFDDGTYLVGKEIQPGTYYVSGDIEGCYWERTNRNGETIDNYFTNSARRVQATIRRSDYSFSSENCGEWQPVR